jgi:hypothetical protein
VNDAKKMAALVLLVILAISFINRGQFTVSSTPSGASGSVGYFGLVK